MSKRIICLDWGYYIHRAIYSKTSYAKDRLVLKMLFCDLKHVGLCQNDTVILATDNHKYPTWRKKYFPEYKQNRKKIDKFSFYHVNKLQKALDMSTKIINVSLSCNLDGKEYGLEADDIISYVVRNTTDQVTIVSHDTDFEQLCFYDHCNIFSPLSKTIKQVKDPMGCLQKKIINKEWSDNLLEKVTTERDYERKKTVVSLLELPTEVDAACKNFFDNLKEKKPNRFYFPIKEVPEYFKTLLT